MPGEARLGDCISCNCPHGGIGFITSGSTKSSSEGIGSARLGDSTMCCICGMPGTIVQGSIKTIIDGMPGSRQGDSECGICLPGFDCCPHGRSGTLVGISPTVSFD